MKQVAVVVGALAMALSATGPAAGAAPTTGPVQNNWLTAFAYSLQHPAALPQGVNDFTCAPTLRHPLPVVLVNGTIEDSYANWSRLAPQLAGDGYCVFAFNYGGTHGSPIQQTGPMRTSGEQLSAFVDSVLKATGADRTDLVGHSQGGLLPLYYVNALDGEAKVHRLIGIEPASQGVHLYGLLPLVAALPGGSAVLGVPCAACTDFTAGSPFMHEVARDGYTRPGVQYTTLVSRTDGLVSVPEAQLPPAPNVTNIVTQDICPTDDTDHVNAVYDDISLRLTRNALDPAHPVAPTCHTVLPLLPPQG